MRLKLIIIILITIIFQGCTMFSIGSSEIQFSNKEMEVLNKARAFYGKSASDVKKDFGEPADVREDVGRNLPDGTSEDYDEVWYYRYGEGIPLLAPRVYGVTFYFKDGKVARVSG